MRVLPEVKPSPEVFVDGDSRLSVVVAEAVLFEFAAEWKRFTVVLDLEELVHLCLAVAAYRSMSGLQNISRYSGVRFFDGENSFSAGHVSRKDPHREGLRIAGKAKNAAIAVLLSEDADQRRLEDAIDSFLKR